MHLAIAAQRGALLGGKELGGKGRHKHNEAPPEQRPHHNPVAVLVENGYQIAIAESKSRDSEGQAAIILVPTMSLIVVALVLLLAGRPRWGGLPFRRPPQRPGRHRQPA